MNMLSDLRTQGAQDGVCPCAAAIHNAPVETNGMQDAVRGRARRREVGARGCKGRTCREADSRSVENANCETVLLNCTKIKDEC